MSEHLEVTLKSGGTISLIVDASLLSMVDADFEFVRGLVAAIRKYQPQPAAPVRVNVVEVPRPKATARTKAKAAPRKRGARAKVDYPEVAKFYLSAVAAGRKPIDALCEHFGVERSVAKNWPTKLRQLGLLPPRDQPVVDATAPMQYVRHG